MCGIADHSTVKSSFPAKGMDTAKAYRNIHFMNVTTEYLPISGLKIPRYSEKLRLLRISMTIPNGVICTEPPVDTLLIIR